MNIIFDYNRTLFDPETDTLYPGAKDLLVRLAKEHQLFLVSKKEPIRIKTITTLGIETFFEKIIFVEEKTKNTFLDLAINPQTTLVIGDCPQSEIAAGNDFGAVTIRVKQGIFKDTLPTSPRETPQHEINSLAELETIIQNYV